MELVECNQIAEGKRIKIGNIIIIGTKKPTHCHELVDVSSKKVEANGILR